MPKTITDYAFDRLPPALQSNYARVRRADGVPEWVERTPPGQSTGKVSDEEYSRMTIGDRASYARQFDQNQFKHR